MMIFFVCYVENFSFFLITWKFSIISADTSDRPTASLKSRQINEINWNLCCEKKKKRELRAPTHANHGYRRQRTKLDEEEKSTIDDHVPSFILLFFPFFLWYKELNECCSWKLFFLFQPDDRALHRRRMCMSASAEPFVLCVIKTELDEIVLCKPTAACI